MRYLCASLCLLLMSALLVAAVPTVGTATGKSGSAAKANSAKSAARASGKSAVQTASGATDKKATMRRTSATRRGSTVQTEPTTYQPADTAAATPELRVLFIGNSHTERHGGMDWLVGNMAISHDPPHPFVGARDTASGVTLEYHYQNGALPLIRDGDWDIVVLQEYLPAIKNQSVEPFLHYARLFDDTIRASGARTVFYMTWPQARYDWADLDDFIAAHRAISAELGAPVAPVGVAMALAAAERPDLALLGEDQVHATWAGAYLAAATIYATLYGETPEGLGFALGLDAEDAEFLQHIAWQAVNQWQAESGPALAAPASDGPSAQS